MKKDNISIKEAYNMGREHYKQGHSIHYDPFRHINMELSSAWIDGWTKEKEKEEKNKKTK